MSISQLVIALNREVDRPVVDRTNLTGRYSFTVKWSPGPLARAGAAPSIFTAVQEQLGLRLEPTTEPVAALVIDRRTAVAEVRFRAPALNEGTRPTPHR
jgi:uncharacterized protein (TIGR03435 family)